MGSIDFGGIRMKKKYPIIISIIVVILLVIAGSSNLLGLDKYHPGRTYANISWVDFVKVDDMTYTKNDTNSTVSESEIDKEIGVVKFELYDSIHYPGYKTKNWDASFLKVGTKLFTLKDDTHSLAALVDGTYYKYTK